MIMEMVYGIDISTFQKNYPYKAAVNEGVKFAILRAGYLDGNKIVKDAQFENHYKGFKDLDIPVGAYWFSYAKNSTEGKKEAEACLQLIKGKQFEYPIFLDYESAAILQGSDYESRTQAVLSFCETVEKAGYYVGVYTNKDWYINRINGQYINKKYDWWAAYWTNIAPTWCNYGIWQQGAKLIATQKTDYNYAYRDYPKLIKENHLNGFTDDEEQKNPLDKYTDRELAEMVLQGKFGNGADRKKALGDRFTKVQDLVNEILWNQDLKVGDKVEIVATGNSQARGGGRTAYGIGYRMRILAVLRGYRYPYRVGNDSGTTGFYTKEALKKI